MYFNINPYKKCVLHKMLDDKQCTIVWHVNGNKLSHVNNKVNDDVLKKIKVRFGDMSIQQGRKL